jgi:hypothetical protein
MKESKKAVAYLPFVDQDVDFGTMHEAYQFLMKVYVDDAIERKQKLLKARSKLAAINAFKVTPKKEEEKVQYYIEYRSACCITLHREESQNFIQNLLLSRNIVAQYCYAFVLPIMSGNISYFK